MGEDMKTAFVIIASGQAYVDYARNLIASIREELWFDPQIYIFTDKPQQLQTMARTFVIDPLGYPKATLMRYHLIGSKAHILKEYDQLFYVDADMLFVDNVKEEYIASDGLTTTLHPGYVGSKGTPESRPESTAFCNDNLAYYCGGFQGGKASAYLQAAATLAAAIDTDTKNGITAIWHDESHWNRLLSDICPAKVLTPSYCYPEDYDGGYGWAKDKYPAKLLCLDKKKRGNHPRFQ
jgi:hypothetical protein